MNVTKLFIISCLLVIMTACSTMEPVVVEVVDAESLQIDEGQQEAAWIIPDAEPKFLRPRTWNLQHQKLWVRFDFEQKQVIGQTEMFFTSLRNHNNELILDAKTMEFDSIYTVHAGRNLEFQQDSAIVTIQLPEYYNRGDSLFIGLSYVATPPNRGLYFVNPQKLDPVKPRQVWTLGQPEDNSFWLPTIDNPEERTTQETWISVPGQYQTLSNGALIESRVLPGDSLRTDYWQMNKPHTPYLFALAVGEYAVSKTWNHGVLFKYYTEPEYAPYADLIYENTEDMLEYIETHTGIAYPWEIYAQVPVREFIARGMENTTASILYDAVQIDERAHQDVSHQGLIMHELIHQWFGNYVTSKNWANLPLNEGFANYFEILYTAYKQGEDDAIWESLSNRDQYFSEARSMRRPIIFNQYTEPEDMYDRHTYAKAGQVLRMLHDYVGDRIWWSALNAYLTEHALSEVDVADLQLIFERESGENLSWFFDQWFHQPGHPEILVSSDTTDQELHVRILQFHDTERQPEFILHTELEIKTDDKAISKNVTIDRIDSTYIFEIDGSFVDILLDPNSVQLAKVTQFGDWRVQLRRLDHPSVAIREYALRELALAEWNSDIESSIVQIAKHDSYPGIRQTAMNMLRENRHEGLADFALSRTFDNEPHSQVRIPALGILEDSADKRVKHHLETMTADTSYFVAAEAIRLYGKLFPEDAHVVLAGFEDTYSYRQVIRNALAEALINSTETEAYRILYNLASHHGDYGYIRTALAGLTGFVDERDVRDDIITLYQIKLEDPYTSTREIARAGLEYIEQHMQPDGGSW